MDERSQASVYLDDSAFEINPFRTTNKTAVKITDVSGMPGDESSKLIPE
jgi:hypothetical protein